MRLWIAVPLLAAAAMAADQPLAEYAPPDTRMVFGFRMRTIVDAMESQGLAAEVHDKVVALLAGTPFAGFDPLKDLDEVLVTTSGQGQNPPALAVLVGRFDVARLGKSATQYRGVPIIESPKTPDGLLALLDGTTALAGTPAVVRAAIDARGGAGHMPAELLARCQALRSRYDIWGAANPIPKTAQPGAEADPFQSVDRFEFGAALRHGLEATAEIHVRSRQDAEKLASTLRLFEAMFKSQQSSANGTRVDLQMKNGTLKVAVNIPAAELKKAVATQRASLEAALLKQMPGGLAARFGPLQSDAASVMRPVPKTPARTLTDSGGNTVSVTLPGGQ
jgi:hypothetical protein